MGQGPTEAGRDGVHDRATADHGLAHTVRAITERADEIAQAVKPRLRGTLHAVMTPVSLVASIVLVALSPTTTAKVSTAVFGVTAVLLFGCSAVYHRGTWSPRAMSFLRRLDHSNIFLLIAGTYTPLATLLLPPGTARVLLGVVWAGAVAGILARVFWLGAPRWLYVPIYLALGWVAVAFLPDFWTLGSPVIVWLIAAGGLAYTLGAVVYATKWPNPSPRWFGFHEIFHVGTVIGYVCHYIAVSIAAYSLAG
ncbi:PAQR family membrane homeostasis protein TrhA [Georgenia faecalis]|uniref:Hemolysin III family protein n=1 Tax=Georgenia faecalis TaxID=2483799 RepID=A0ABV9D679_9MICO|nr:hemolysin III family protein [Georgenia faecalis]